MSPSVVCPIPQGISHDDARAMFNQVRKENPKATPATIRREAARRMGTDYDTYLQAWKKPTTTPVTPPPIVVPDPPITVINPVKPIKVSKETVPEPFNISYFSDTLKSDAKSAVRIKHGDTVIGHVQRGMEGSWERTATGVRTGRFFVDKRGWIALDEKGSVLKDGFTRVFESQDDAIKFLTKRADIKPEPPVRLPTPTPQPAPDIPPLSYDTARQQFKLVKKENKGFTDAQARREAAKRMNVDYDTYLKAWKGDKSATTPKTPPVKTVPTTEPVVVEQGLELSQSSVRGLLDSMKVDPDKYDLLDTTDGVKVRLRIDADAYDKQVVINTLRDAGFKVDVLGNSIRVLKPRRLIRTASEENPPWKPKSVGGPEVTVEDGIIYEGDQNLGKIVYERGFWRFRTTYGEARLDRNMIFKSYDDAVAAAKKQLGDGLADYRAVNRGRLQGVPGTQKNCTSCTSSYELRRRGFDVEARTMPQGQQLPDVYRSWGIRTQDQAIPSHLDYTKPSQGWSYPISVTRKQGLEWMAKQPDGARGFITCNWRNGGAHIFNWEVRDGKVWFIDAQVQLEWEFTSIAQDRWFKRMEDDIWVARVDELEIDPTLVDWLTSDHGQVPITGAPKWVSNVKDHQKDLELS